MYAVSADSKGLDTVVGLLADVVLHPRLTGGHPGRVRGRWGWDPWGRGAVPLEEHCCWSPQARRPVSWHNFSGNNADEWDSPGCFMLWDSSLHPLICC